MPLFFYLVDNFSATLGNGIPIVDRRAHVQLVMTKWLNEGIVEGKVRYANEEGMGFTDFTPLPTFPSVVCTSFSSLKVISLYLTHFLLLKWVDAVGWGQ